MLENLFEEDSSIMEEHKQTELTELVEFSNKSIQLQQEIDIKEEEIQKLKKQKKELDELKIPLKMDTLGLKEFALKSGEKLKIKKDVYAKIPTSQINNAFSWLDNNGFGDIIHSEIVVKFNRDEQEQYKKIVTNLATAEYNYVFTQKENIHHSRLKSFVTEQIEINQEFPKRYFGVYERNIVKFSK